MYKYVNRPTHIWLNSFWLVKEKSPSVSFWQNSGWLINQNFRVALKFELLGFLPLISYLIIVHIIPKWIRQELWIILFNPDLMQVWGQYPVGASNCFSLSTIGSHYLFWSAFCSFPNMCITIQGETNQLSSTLF